jgi:hypothetical protein
LSFPWESFGSERSPIPISRVFSVSFDLRNIFLFFAVPFRRTSNEMVEGKGITTAENPEQQATSGRGCMLCRLACPSRHCTSCPPCNTFLSLRGEWAMEKHRSPMLQLILYSTLPLFRRMGAGVANRFLYKAK